MDARIIRTRRDLSNALIQLLETTDYDEIKVIDICKKAMISKVTFYNNFKNKSELLNHILLEFEDKIKNDIEKVAPAFQNQKDMILGIVRIAYKNVLKNKIIFGKILSNHQTSSVIIELRNFICQEIIKHGDLLISDDKSSVPKEYFAAFYSGAITSILPMVLNQTDGEDNALDENSLVALFS